MFLISVVGSVVALRILSLLEKAKLILRHQLLCWFVLIQFALCLIQYFKEQKILYICFIGLFLIILMLLGRIIEKFYDLHFKQLHISIIQRLYVLISRGESASRSLVIVKHEMSELSKLVFAPIFNDSLYSKETICAKNSFQNQFFEDLRQIMTSKLQISAQLQDFKRYLELKEKLRHRSRQSLRSLRAQSFVCTVIWTVLLTISVRYLSLDLFSQTTGYSILLLIVGNAVIWKLGGDENCLI